MCLVQPRRRIFLVFQFNPLNVNLTTGCWWLLNWTGKVQEERVVGWNVTGSGECEIEVLG